MTLRRDLLLRSALLASAGFFAAPARADTAWNPDRALRIIVPVAPGGSLDILGRLLAKHLTEALGQNVVTENKPGAGSNIAFELVARAQAMKPATSRAGAEGWTTSTCGARTASITGLKSRTGSKPTRG